MKAVDVVNIFIPAFEIDPEPKKTFDNMADFEVRDDDIMLCSFPKTGALFHTTN